MVTANYIVSSNRFRRILFGPSAPKFWSGQRSPTARPVLPFGSRERRNARSAPGLSQEEPEGSGDCRPRSVAAPTTAG